MIEEKNKVGGCKRMRRIIAFAAAVLLAGSVLPCAAAETTGRDIVIVMEVSALGVLAEGTGNAPWFGCPCLNGEHFYLAPVKTEPLPITYPPAEAVSGAAAQDGIALYDDDLQREVLLDGGKELRFKKSFLTDAAARGFESWKYHFMRNGAGAPVRIEVSAENGCFGRDGAIRALAAALAAALTAGEGNRAAVVPCGAAGDSRYMTPLTAETELLFAAIDAAPALGGGDAASGLAAALRLLNRRPLLERLGRPAAVLLLTGGDIFPAAVWERCSSLVRLLESPGGSPGEVPFGVFVPESLACGAGAAVFAAGVLAEEGGFFDLLERAGAEVRFLPENEKAEAAASALQDMIFEGDIIREPPS